MTRINLRNYAHVALAFAITAIPGIVFNAIDFASGPGLHALGLTFNGLH